MKKIYRGLLQNLVHIFSLLDLILIYNLYFSAEELTEENLHVLHTFSLKVGEGLSEETWAKMIHTFHCHNIPSLKLTKARVEFLAAYRPVAYDCCINSCIVLKGLVLRIT